MNKINLCVGDSSGDGHERRDNYLIESNLNKKQMLKSYKKGSKILGFDFMNTVAKDYEDSKLSIEMLTKLRDNGYDGKIFDESYCKNGHGPNLQCGEYVDIVLFVCKLGDPAFKYEYIKEDFSWDIGGYGLYYNWGTMSQEHVEANIKRMEEIIRKSAKRIDALKTGERLPVTALAAELGAEYDIAGAQLYPIISVLMHKYPGFIVYRGAKGGIGRISESKKEVLETDVWFL